MANLFTNAYDISLSQTGAWVDIDVSAYCPAGTAGVIIQVVNTYAGAVSWGLRKKGSTDARITNAYNLCQTWGYIGVDTNRVIQGYTSNTLLKFKLLGYFTTDGVFFTNSYNKSPGGSDGWRSINCSTEIPAGAKFAIVEMVENGQGFNVGLRPTGSTDNRTAPAYNQHLFGLVGLDVNRTFDFYNHSNIFELHLIGYLTSGTFKTNGVDVSLTSTGAYINIDRSGDGDATNAEGVLVEAKGTSLQFAIRKNGSTDDFYKDTSSQAWGVIGLDANKIFQGKISSTNEDFYIMGYLVPPPPPQTWAYAGSIPLSILPQSGYEFPRTWEYAGNIALSLLPQSAYLQEWQYHGNIPLSIIPASGYLWFLGWEYSGNISLALSLAGDYFAVLGRTSIPGPYVLRYPNPKSGQTNVPVGNPIKFIIKSDGPGINIDTVKVKVTDSWGINIYDKTSPYFKYSGKKSRYEVEVKPPQPWAYEGNVQVEIEAWDLAVPPVQGVVYEYVP